MTGTSHFHISSVGGEGINKGAKKGRLKSEEDPLRHTSREEMDGSRGCQYNHLTVERPKSDSGYDVIKTTDTRLDQTPSLKRYEQRKKCACLVVINFFLCLQIFFEF